MLARVAWGLWWLAGLAVPLVQFPATSVEDSGALAFAAWAVVAGWLSLWTPPQRTLKTGGVSVLLAAFLVQPVLGWASLQGSDWVEAWGLMARLTSAGVFVVCLAWGTQAVLRHSPSIGRGLPYVLAGVLAVNLLCVRLQYGGGWDGHGEQYWTISRWAWNVRDDLGGVFSSKTVWGAWAVLSLPLVWALPGWRRVWAVPVLAAVVLSQRTTVTVALLVWLLWRFWPWLCRHPRLGLGTLLIGEMLWLWRVESLDSMVAGVLPRLATWPVILGAILQHPLGIGWHPMAYMQLVSQAQQPIMGHPSSALLAWTLAGGWAVGLAVLGTLVWWGRRLRRDGLSGALVVGLVLLLISRTLAQAQVGVLAWVLGCVWLMQRSEECDARMA